jgi:hypothetical protein
LDVLGLVGAKLDKTISSLWIQTGSFTQGHKFTKSKQIFNERKRKEEAKRMKIEAENRNK